MHFNLHPESAENGGVKIEVNRKFNSFIILCWKLHEMFNVSLTYLQITYSSMDS